MISRKQGVDAQQYEQHVIRYWCYFDGMFISLRFNCNNKVFEVCVCPKYDVIEINNECYCFVPTRHSFCEYSRIDIVRVK